MHFPDKLDCLAVLCALMIPFLYVQERVKSYWHALIQIWTYGL